MFEVEEGAIDIRFKEIFRLSSRSVESKSFKIDPNFKIRFSKLQDPEENESVCYITQDIEIKYESQTDSIYIPHESKGKTKEIKMKDSG